MVPPNLGQIFDMKKIGNLRSQLPKEASEAVGKLTQQISGYEARVRDIVKDLDSRSREAKELSRQRLDQFAKQLRKTRTDLEKRVGDLVLEERKKLQDRVVELIDYLKKVANVEGSSPVKTAPKKKTSSSSKNKSPKKATKSAASKHTGAASRSRMKKTHVATEAASASV